MCRFVLYLGNELLVSSLITEPTNSIIRQSYDSKERDEPLNGDGFGVAWYVPAVDRHPAIVREVSPAWSNQNLFNVARVTTSRCILGHVRAATPGLPVTLLNCHPFAWRHYAFMHNGHVAGFRAIRRDLLRMLSDEAFDAINGNTDSEAVFGRFIDRLNAEDDALPAHDRMANALAMTIGDVVALAHAAGYREPSYLNLAVTDGECAVASRFVSDVDHTANSLYVHTGRRYVCEGGVCRMLDAEEAHGATIIASERLSDDEGWSKVAPSSLVVVAANGEVSFREVEI